MTSESSGDHSLLLFNQDAQSDCLPKEGVQMKIHENKKGHT